ncbi:aminotransferase-like domain-containing protein [Mangrovicoccus algicola]|uniref:PLP-dependent aminotransferase family protein n=1 Tax=Mangrovicoccus algicola TaxID=2771008 RepID=A0A8J7CXG5_9RHOB|nr:PLP-dependent aminotransferase family protein [Mangrovicoccus algicola]MBE3640439.1 PLP-dependent aminotransferase family protein [Mangrovicoccus algicola]
MTPRTDFAAWLQGTNDMTSRFVGAAGIAGLVNVAGGLPDPSLFPSERLADIAAGAIRGTPEVALGYGPTPGLPELRAEIAARFRARGAAVTAENVMITASGSQALDLIGKVLIEPGRVIGCDFPTYAGALDAFRPRAPRYRHLDLADHAGLPAALLRTDLAYLVPNFSNPTGKLVDLETRRALVAAAEETGTWLIEDDPYGALYYDGPALPGLLELSCDGGDGPYRGPVIHLGSLSKQLVPGLRVGWVIAAPEVIAQLSSAKQATDLCSNTLAQMMTLAALREGLVEEVHPRAIALYRERRSALAAAMARHISAWFDWEVPVGGMFIWARAKDRRLDVEQVVEAGLAEGVLVGPGSAFDPMGLAGPALRLNFTANDAEGLDRAMARLARAMQAVSPAAAPAGLAAG